ncbi:MAG TPA: PAS domain S-box protein, partial [Allocoleopsis sp.]
MMEDSLLQKARLVFENTHDSILFLTADGTILDTNKAAINTYRYNQEEFKQIKISDLVYNQQHNYCAEQFNLAPEETIRFETNHQRKDGTHFPAEVTLQSVLLGEEKIFFAMIRNITERKQVETEKRQIQLILMALQKFTSSRNIDLTERMNKILKIGCRWLGLEMSAVGEIKDNKYYPIFTYAKHNVTPILKKGDIFDLSVTYCGRTFAHQKITYVIAAGKSAEWCLHPLYQALKIESYIGVPIFVNGKVYGTLCFFGLKERLKEFTNYEKELVKLIAQGIGAEIQHQQAEIELIKSQNRLALLNTISNS